MLQHFEQRNNILLCAATCCSALLLNVTDTPNRVILLWTSSFHYTNTSRGSLIHIFGQARVTSLWISLVAQIDSLNLHQFNLMIGRDSCVCFAECFQMKYFHTLLYISYFHHHQEMKILPFCQIKICLLLMIWLLLLIDIITIATFIPHQFRKPSFLIVLKSWDINLLTLEWILISPSKFNSKSTLVQI